MVVEVALMVSTWVTVEVTLVIEDLEGDVYCLPTLRAQQMSQVHVPFT